MSNEIVFHNHKKEIQSIKIFDFIDNHAIKLYLFRKMSPAFFDAGQILYDQDQDPLEIFFIINGMVELKYKDQTQGFNMNSAGDMVGCTAVLAHKPYDHMCIAKRKTYTYYLNIRDISDMIKNMPYVAIALQLAIASSLQVQNEEFEHLRHTLRVQKLRSFYEECCSLSSSLDLKNNEEVIKSLSSSHAKNSVITTKNAIVPDGNPSQSSKKKFMEFDSDPNGFRKSKSSDRKTSARRTFAILTSPKYTKDSNKDERSFKLRRSLSMSHLERIDYNRNIKKRKIKHAAKNILKMIKKRNQEKSFLNPEMMRSLSAKQKNSKINPLLTNTNSNPLLANTNSNPLLAMSKVLKKESSHNNDIDTCNNNSNNSNFSNESLAIPQNPLHEIPTGRVGRVDSTALSEAEKLVALSEEEKKF